MPCRIWLHSNHTRVHHVLVTYDGTCQRDWPKQSQHHCTCLSYFSFLRASKASYPCVSRSNSMVIGLLCSVRVQSDKHFNKIAGGMLLSLHSAPGLSGFP